MPIPKDFSKPVRLSAKERAFQQLQEWIIDGTLQPLEKLNDAELATALGVSRTPVREALQLLNMQGFVEMHPGVATQVTAVSAEDVVKILPVLGAIQSLAVEMALAEDIVSIEILKSMEQKNEEFAVAVRAKDFYTALKIDEQFHQYIIHVIDNEYIANILENYQAHVRRLYFHDSIIITNESVEEHAQLIKALREKDVKLASDLAKKNWVRTIDEYAARNES